MKTHDEHLVRLVLNKSKIFLKPCPLLICQSLSIFDALAIAAVCLSLIQDIAHTHDMGFSHIYGIVCRAIGVEPVLRTFKPRCATVVIIMVSDDHQHRNSLSVLPDLCKFLLAVREFLRNVCHNITAIDGNEVVKILDVIIQVRKRSVVEPGLFVIRALALVEEMHIRESQNRKIVA